MRMESRRGTDVSPTSNLSWARHPFIVDFALESLPCYRSGPTRPVSFADLMRNPFLYDLSIRAAHDMGVLVEDAFQGLDRSDMAFVQQIASRLIVWTTL